MKENLRPGPKPPPKRAVNGMLCPPGSEGAKLYRGIRAFRKVCKYGGHKKPYPGRCVACRHLGNQRRDKKLERKKDKRKNYTRWSALPENKKKIAGWAARRNARREQKDAAAARQRRYRREFADLPESLQAAILALREVKQLIRKSKGVPHGKH
jgi:hypothetical protein